MDERGKSGSRLKRHKGSLGYRTIIIFEPAGGGQALNAAPVNGYGLSYSCVSKCAGIVRKGLREVKRFKGEFDGFMT